MQIDPAFFPLALLASTGGSIVVLYIMRRRVRLGRRVAKF